MKNHATSKICSAKQHWHNTIGEYLLRYTGIFLAATIVFIGLSYGYNKTPAMPDRGPGHQIKVVPERAAKTLYFVMLNSDASYTGQADVLKEAIASYHGVNLVSVQGNYNLPEFTESQIVFVMGSQQVDDPAGLRQLMAKVAENDVPLFWLGSGFGQVARLFDVPLSGDAPLSVTPPVSSLLYKGTRINASGLPFSRVKLDETAGVGDVLASITLQGSFQRAALVRYGPVIYSAFSPFSQRSAPYALAVIMDSLSLLVGEHKANPRVIFRLEDINGYAYNQYDSSFRKTVDFLVDQGVYVHLGIIPSTVDAQGKLLANIDSALPVLEFISKYPEQTGIVQHGYRHFRKDPRNEGMGSGDAFEFFLNDDETMGIEQSQNFARKVILQGRELMMKNGLNPYIFEAPHYAISPAQQKTAEEIFSLMQHEPLFYGNRPSGFFLPWYTQRNTTVYAPGSAGYVDALNADSVDNILYSLEQAAAILPDPVVVVFFHPFMRELTGREQDLEKLILGIKKLNYRFVNMMDEVEPIAARP